MTSFPTIGVGVPYRFVGDGWDVGPLVLAIALVALLHLARFRLRAPTLAGAALGGLIIDHLTDAFDVSIATAMATLTLAFTIVALARISAR
ncbi:MAG TPA: hypothetical protein VFZ75_00375 [Actinomycetota bacterium]|nr:hypothetical protein [Actinomycetota bacterium]